MTSMNDRGDWLGRRRVPSPSDVLGLIARPSRRRAAAVVRRAHDIDDLRRLGRRRVPRMVFDYVDGGAGDEETLRRNARAFTQTELVPRVLRDVTEVDVSTTLLGRPAAMPLWLAPVGMTRMAHPHGEIGAARAAARAGIPYLLSTMASATPEQIAQYVPDGERWFQLYLWRDRDFSRRIVERARDAGFHALVLTVDVPVAGLRLRDVRNGMTLPPALNLRSVLDVAKYPRWWFDALTREPLTSAAVGPRAESFTQRVGRIIDPSATFDDLDWLRSLWPGPIVIKGVPSAPAARELLDRGADALIISNHGGRQLENASATFDLVPEIRAEIGSDTPLYLDGGVRSGAHIAAALAAGADAVGIGRPYVYGLMAGGEQGVDRCLDILRSGLTRTMSLLGARSLDEVDASLLRTSPGRP